MQVFAVREKGCEHSLDPDSLGYLINPRDWDFIFAVPMEPVTSSSVAVEGFFHSGSLKNCDP